jgi:hypothetical protein
MSEESKVPAMPGKNPFEDYADRTDTQMWLGALLKFTKGDYVVGRDGEECPEKEMVALMLGLLCGWIRWQDNYPVEHVMGLLMEGYVPPARETLGHHDKTTWELGNQDKPRDPWQEGVYLPMISVNGEVVYTFTTTSDGGRRRAIAPLCREYGARIRQHPNELPIIGLEQDSYLHPDRTIGRVKYPLFPIKRWVKADPYLAAVMTLTGKSLKLLPSAQAA